MAFAFYMNKIFGKIPLPIPDNNYLPQKPLLAIKNSSYSIKKLPESDQRPHSKICVLLIIVENLKIQEKKMVRDLANTLRILLALHLARGTSCAWLRNGKV